MNFESELVTPRGFLWFAEYPSGGGHTMSFLMPLGVWERWAARHPTGF